MIYYNLGLIWVLAIIAIRTENMEMLLQEVWQG